MIVQVRLTGQSEHTPKLDWESRTPETTAPTQMICVLQLISGPRANQ